MAHLFGQRPRRRSHFISPMMLFIQQYPQLAYLSRNQAWGGQIEGGF
jgi:hypothetical protein